MTSVDNEEGAQIALRKILTIREEEESKEEGSILPMILEKSSSQNSSETHQKQLTAQRRTINI